MGGRPDVCVSRCRTSTPLRWGRGSNSSSKNRATGCRRCSRPCSTNCMTRVAVASGLVSDARSNTVSVAACPNAFSASRSPPRIRP